MTEKQVLEETIAKYNDSVNDISKLKFSSKEVDLFCGMLTRFADMKISEQLIIDGVMPRSLTAENGAKALLIGEFNETYEAYDETEGDYNVDIPVQWTTIKDIYKKIVDHYEANACV